jgi:hypothetical protein
MAFKKARENAKKILWGLNEAVHRRKTEEFLHPLT